MAGADGWSGLARGSCHDIAASFFEGWTGLAAARLEAADRAGRDAGAPAANPAHLC